MLSLQTHRGESLRIEEKYGTPFNYVNGANIGGFVKVADSMLDQGIV
jgi:glutamate dehydrogenase (NADP+)